MIKKKKKSTNNNASFAKLTIHFRYHKVYSTHSYGSTGQDNGPTQNFCMFPHNKPKTTVYIWH